MAPSLPHCPVTLREVAGSIAASGWILRLRAGRTPRGKKMGHCEAEGRGNLLQTACALERFRLRADFVVRVAARLAMTVFFLA